LRRLGRMYEGQWILMKDKQTSFEPRPKPETTLPLIRNGNGGSGPESGPIIVGRGPSGRIVLSNLSEGPAGYECL